MVKASPNLDSDLLKVPEGYYQELYTPAAGRVKSAELGNKSLEYCKIFLPVSVSVTWKGYLNETAVTATLPAGPFPFLVKEISAAGGVVMIIHDGVLWSGDADYTPKMAVHLP
jgi:hypothetical protein